VPVDIVIRSRLSFNDYWPAVKQALYYLDKSKSPNMNFLTNLAASCPDSEGDAVFIARARLAELGQDTIYDDYNLCAQVGHANVPIETKSTEKGTSVDGLIVWPNPAGNIFSVKTSAPISYVRLIDLSGKLVKKWEATGNEISFRIGGLSTGMYVIEVTLYDGTRITESIILNGNR
jgi:Secretion system C-terminal sorting domain